MPLIKVLILGHSYARRLERIDYDWHLDDDTSVEYCGEIRGVKLNTLTDMFNHANDIFQEFGVPDLIFLFMGSNDLIEFEPWHPSIIATLLVGVCNLLYTYGVRRVVIPEVVARFGPCGLRVGWQQNWVDGRYGSMMERYFLWRVNVFNGCVRRTLSAYQQYEPMKMVGFPRNASKWLYDGVHPNAEGFRALRNLLRWSMIKNVLKCKGLAGGQS